MAATAVAWHEQQAASVTLLSRSEAGTTARCAGSLIELWQTGNAGAHLPEMVIPPRQFLDTLSAHGMRITHDETAEAPPPPT